ncbi:MAG: TraB/GumN family protein [Deferribacteres bacterium]|nr:TraB/GumN family protein [candidate division KSB1 bacterium]MCB9500503.1 TraB/GumN family protein [Deferribacteres bacterium]
MHSSERPRREYPSDVQTLTVGHREFIIVGTAHISQESADLVREVIENEKPDCVCVELDEKRHKALAQKQRWEELDLKTIIRQKQLATLLVNLLLGSYQKRLGEKLGVVPGLELLEATKVAEEHSIPIKLCDRDVRITLRRAWNSMSFFKKMQFMSSGLVGVLENPDISEAQLKEIKQKDVLNDLMQELGEAMPVLKRVLIDERDTYLTQNILAAEGEKIVAVVGAGHVKGIVHALQNHKPIDLAQIEVIPPISPMWKIIGWGIPALIVGSIVYIGFQKGPEAAGDNALFWIIANGLPSMIGTIVALGHPITIITAFIAAPFTSLTPLIGAGYVTAFVQAYFRPPVVREFQTVSKDFGSFPRWWQNKLLRIFLVFLLSGIGSIVGTWVGAMEIFSNLF